MKLKLNRFGNIDLKDIISKLKKDDIDSVNLIQYYNKQLQLKDRLNQIEELNDDIKPLKKECKDLYKGMEDIHRKNPPLREDYQMNFTLTKIRKK